MTVAQQLSEVRKKISEYAARYQRDPAGITLLAVSKQQSLPAIQAAVAEGQCDFGENYLQEALNKITVLSEAKLCWHFIGPIQSNKTRDIAAHFSWVHSIDRLKIAERLNAQRPEHLTPLNVCIEVNLDNERTKAGIAPAAVTDFAKIIRRLPRLKLRGLMAIPQVQNDFSGQRQAFANLRMQLESLNQLGMDLDTLSMGMSDDLEAAIAEGATCVRIGKAIFGARQ